MRQVLLLALALAPQTLQAQRPAARDTTVPQFAHHIDEVAAAADLMPLRSPSAIGDAQREIRLWSGFGVYAPQDLVRIVVRDDQVEGMHLLWWHPSAPEDEAEAERESSLVSNRELYENLRHRYGCGPRQVRGDYEYCVATRLRIGTWADFLKRLDSLQVATLPDGWDLKRGFDGTSLVVEVRNGTRYRTYAYWTPMAGDSAPQSRQAAEILRMMHAAGTRE